MKQITLRLNENGVTELIKIQEMLGTKTAQATIEHCLLTIRTSLNEARDFEKKWHDACAVIEYLEAELKKERWKE
jgi:dynactin complex subunit